MAHGFPRSVDREARTKEEGDSKNGITKPVASKGGIDYLEWLVKRPGEGKKRGSIVIHFRSEVDCNKVLGENFIYESRLYETVRHLPDARVKQCFNCG